MWESFSPPTSRSPLRDPIRYGRPLFGTIEDERFPLPVIIPLCLSGDGIDTVTWDNFGKEVKLYLYERRTE